MNDGVSAGEAADVAVKTVNSARLLAAIVERRIEVLLGTLIAYQFGLLDSLVATGSQCLA